MYRKMKSVMEAAALDPERLSAPKSIWFDDEELEKWFKERRRVKVDSVE